MVDKLVRIGQGKRPGWMVDLLLKVVSGACIWLGVAIGAAVVMAGLLKVAQSIIK